MIELTIEKKDSGSRFDKYLKKILPGASSGLIYKQLRKKNITLNGNKSDGKELIKSGDVIRLFFSDETYNKFHNANFTDYNNYYKEYINAYSHIKNVEIIYEDDDIAALNKPVGILSQKSDANDISLNEWWIGYLISNRGLTAEEMSVYKPSVVNRLDRNTSGIVLAAKTLSGSIELSELIRERRIKKFYRTVLLGKIVKNKQHIEGFLSKDLKSNIVTIKDKLDSSDDMNNYSKIETEYNLVKELTVTDEYILSLVEVELLTGKTHQIRAHMSHIGHPILGDPKYGNAYVNNIYKKRDISHQLLHSYRVEFPDDCKRIPKLNGLTLICKEPSFYGNLEK